MQNRMTWLDCIRSQSNLVDNTKQKFVKEIWLLWLISKFTLIRWQLSRHHGTKIVNSLWPSDAYICIGNLTIIGSDNGLLPGRHQAIIWTNAGLLLIPPLGTNFNEILIGIHTFSFKENEFENDMCNMAAIMSRPQCVNWQWTNTRRKINT